MMGVFRSLPLSFKAVFKDPINVSLVIFPTLIALALYIFAIVSIFKNADYLGAIIHNYIPEPQTAGWVGRLLTALLIIFVFLLMSWTYVIVVGIIAAPFNSMLSERIEDRLVGKKVEDDRSRTFKEVFHDLGGTFKNEIKKLFFIVLLSLVALFLNLFPLFYPLGIFLIALLLAVQFVDYSWSRHEMHWGACLKDVTQNMVPYALSGFFFLLLVTVPIINAFVPAMATSYYTVLWLYRQKKILPESLPSLEKK
jgi:CysZ protein